MTELALIGDLALIWIVAAVAGYICARLKIPLIAGYTGVGILIGPHGLRWIAEPGDVHVLAEMGVALLLFALGVEVSLRQILKCSIKVVGTAVIQIAFTVIAAWTVARLFGFATTPAAGILFGWICALSSTVVVTKTLMDRGEIDAIHGRMLLPVLIVQDLSLVPVIALLPAFQGAGDNLTSVILLALAKAVLLIGSVLVGAYTLVPALLKPIVKSQHRELFLLTILGLCLGIAIMSDKAGLSLALGAFLAGIMVSESKYGSQALVDVMPLRDLFAVVFFVSIGMLLNPAFLATHVVEVFAFVGLLLVLKVIIGTASAFVSTSNWWSALLFGVGIAQIGEFSFVLAMLGYQAKLLEESLYNLFFAAAVVTLVLSPILMNAVPRLLGRFASVKAREEAGVTGDGVEEHGLNISGHVIICGFGRTGRNLGMVLSGVHIPYAVVELNASILDELDAQDVPHVFGDSVSHLVLQRAGLARARVLIVTVPDPLAALTIINMAREMNPEVKIIVRAHRSEDINVLRAAGANAVVQPEFEAGIEISRLTLMSLNMGDPIIQRALQDVRTQRYRLFQPDVAEASLAQLIGFAHDEFIGTWFVVTKSAIVGQSLQQLDIRRLTGVTISAARRGNNLVVHPDPTFKLAENDELYVVGTQEQLVDFEDTYQITRFCPTSEYTSDDISPSRLLLEEA
jgi:monovalent cation:H+ antiporter-2, CPA2 family